MRYRNTFAINACEETVYSTYKTARSFLVIPSTLAIDVGCKTHID